MLLPMACLQPVQFLQVPWVSTRRKPIQPLNLQPTIIPSKPAPVSASGSINAPSKDRYANPRFEEGDPILGIVNLGLHKALAAGSLGYYKIVCVAGSNPRSTKSYVNPCILSLTGMIFAEYFRSVYGFTYNADANIPLVWPTNSTSEKLTVLLHLIIRLCQDGMNVPAAAGDLLRGGGVDTGAVPRAPDFMTNCAAWVNEMASIYPSASFTSIDTKPLIPHTPHSRINYEVHDFYAGIIEPDASFDIVHVRQRVLATNNFNLLLREMHRVLKPGGFLLVEELLVRAYETANPSMLLRSALRRAEGVRLLRAAWERQGVDTLAWDDLVARLDPGYPLWDNQPSVVLDNDPTKFPEITLTVRGFRSARLRTELVPSGTWLTDPKQRTIGALAHALIAQCWKWLKPMLLLIEWDEVEADEIVTGILDEFEDENFRSYLKCHMWSARRI